MDETLGSDGGMLVGVVKAVGAPEHGFCFYMKHGVRVAAESEGGLGTGGWRRAMERRGGIQSSSQRMRKKFLEKPAGIAGQNSGCFAVCGLEFNNSLCGLLC